MRYATIRIRRNTEDSMQEVRKRFLKAWSTEEYQGETFEFESPAALFRLLTPKRWDGGEASGAGETSLRGLARLLGRDVRRVWDDVHALLDSGIVEKNDEGKLFVPYTEINADFTLRKVA